MLPVGIDSTWTAFASPIFMIEPLPNWRSIWEMASSIARSRSDAMGMPSFLVVWAPGCQRSIERGGYRKLVLFHAPIILQPGGLINSPLARDGRHNDATPRPFAANVRGLVGAHGDAPGLDTTAS